MRLVSPLLKHVVYPALHYSGWLGRVVPSSGFAVVNYHGIVPEDHSGVEAFLDGNLVQPDVFRQQLRFLKSHYHVVHPDEFRTWIENGVEQARKLPPRAVLLTCDDGLLNTLTDMLPVLQSENISCLFLVTAASCTNEPGMLWYEELYLLMRAEPLPPDLQLPPEEDTDSPSSTLQAQWWNTVRRASRLDATTRADWMRQVRVHGGPTPALRSERRWRLLNVIELKKLVEAGMSIGAHTLSHPILSLCSEEEARHEVQESKNSLEKALGRPVWAFAYPFGNPSTTGGNSGRPRSL